MCNDFSKVVNPLPTTEVKQQIATIETTVQTNLTHLDEFSGVIDSMKSSSKKASSVLIPKLLDRSQHVKELFTKIDAYQVYLDKLEASVAQMEARIDLVEKSYGGGVVNKLLGSLGGLFDDRRKRPLCLDWQPVNFIVKSKDYFLPQEKASEEDSDEEEKLDSKTETSSGSKTETESQTSAASALLAGTEGEEIAGEGDEEEDEEEDDALSDSASKEPPKRK